METLVFRSLASGSSGNCYYLGTRKQGILLDAGISARTIRTHLREMGLDFSNIMGVLITHDHADHIRAVGALGERFHIPIYATQAIHDGIDRNYGVREKLKTCRKYFIKGETFTLCGMNINTFGISHDSTECVGYVIDAPTAESMQRFVLATDVGCINEQLENYVRSANHLVIEANHDEEMLLNGPYPSYLKARILSERGHMSNDSCGELLARNYHDGIRNIFLCHLSHENNTTETALTTIENALKPKVPQIEKQCRVRVLARCTPSEIIELK